MWAMRGGGVTHADNPPQRRSGALRPSLRSHHMSGRQVDTQAPQAQQILRAVGTGQGLPLNAACGDCIALGVDAAKDGNG
jgi:hypothetical protein